MALALVATVALSKSFAASAPATDAPGPFKTETSEYRMPAGIDPDVLPGQATEIWARAYWPAQLADPSTGKSQKHPLLVFLHGNHGTCGSGVGPRNDSSCEYTNEGTCPNGYVVTPNHEGYNYVAENLASWGYIVVSINANRGITCGSGNSDDWGLVLARGRLVLKHLQLWSDWSTKGGAPTAFGSPERFVGAVDFANVGLMGHSRGGEGVRAALNLYRDPGSTWVSKIPGLDIRAIFEIGAVDGQSNRVLDAPSVAWNQLLPLCDGDVSDLQGRMPFERMMSRFSAKQEAESRPSPKSLTMVWGANHNYFNTEWQTSDSYGCSGSPTHKPLFDENKPVSVEQQGIALQSMSAFFRSNVGATRSVSLGQHFDPAYEFPTVFSNIGPVDRDFIPAFELSKVLRVDDFTGATGTNPAGSANTTSNVKVEHDANAEPPVANIDWQNGASDRFYQSNFKEPGQSADVSGFDYLDFRVGRSMDDSAVELKTTVNFSVQLVAADETLSKAVSIQDFSKLFGPPNDNTELTQTVRIPVAAFGPFDLAKIRGVRFVFDQTPTAKIRLAHVRFGVSSDKITTVSASPLSTIEDLNRAAMILNGGPLNTMDSKPAETTPPENILPENGSALRLLMTPHNLPVPRILNAQTVQRGSWMRPRKIKHSRQLFGDAAIELMVETRGLFPVMDAAPVLNIENRLFHLARFPSNGKTNALIFTIPADAYEELPELGRAQVQYGFKNPARVWRLPNFSKVSNRNLIGN